MRPDLNTSSESEKFIILITADPVKKINSLMVFPYTEIFSFNHKIMHAIDDGILSMKIY